MSGLRPRNRSERLPAANAAAAWIDIRAAADAVERAEAQIRAGRMDLAWPAANIAVVIGRRGFLAREDNPWMQARLGNRGEVLRAYARLRELLKDELGTSPSAETERIYLTSLQA